MVPGKPVPVALLRPSPPLPPPTVEPFPPALLVAFAPVFPPFGPALLPPPPLKLLPVEPAAPFPPFALISWVTPINVRSEERRVGKEGRLWRDMDEEKKQSED